MQLDSLIEKWLTVGYDNLSLYERNNVIVSMADRSGIVPDTMTESVLLEENKKLRISMFEEKCESTILEGFKSKVNGHVYRTNRDDQMNMIGKKDYLMSHPEETTVLWKTEDAGYVAHTREDWFTIYYEAYKHKEQALLKYNMLKLKVMIAKTDVELIPLTWNNFVIPVPEAPIVKPVEPEQPVEDSPEESPVDNEKTEEPTEEVSGE